MDATTFATSLTTSTDASEISTHSNRSSREFGSGTPWRARTVCVNAQKSKDRRFHVSRHSYKWQTLTELLHFIRVVYINSCKKITNHQLSLMLLKCTLNDGLYIIFCTLFFWFFIPSTYGITVQRVPVWIFFLSPYLAWFGIYVLQDEVHSELAASDRNRICDVISDEVAARAPIAEKHKSLEVKWHKKGWKNYSHTALFK